MQACKNDIAGRKDIEMLINTFYEKVRSNPLISHYFTHIDWDHHLPIMYQFWENILFYTGGYNGNPMQIHHRLHQRDPLDKESFQEWLKLFNETVDTLFSGDNAELIKQRALSIATIMQIKILYPDNQAKPFGS